MDTMNWPRLLGLALDEVYRLRKLVAEERRRVETDLGFARYPKSRRGAAGAMIRRLDRAARGWRFETANHQFPEVSLLTSDWLKTQGVQPEQYVEMANQALNPRTYADVAFTCGEVLCGGGSPCGKPAAFLLWGRLFPKSALGPRCVDHTMLYVNGKLDRIEQWAVLDLRRLVRETT